MTAADLLDRAVEAHGGLARFEATERIAADLRVSGWALAMRFQRGKLSNYTGTVSTREPHAVLDPYPALGKRGVFDRHDVRIESADGAVLEERKGARRFYRGRRYLWWDDLDLLYFASYALWGYIGAPFIFTRPGYEVEEIEPWREGDEQWRGLRVRFPEDVPVLFVAGAFDTEAPVDDVRKLTELCSGDAELAVLDQRDHFDLWTMDERHFELWQGFLARIEDGRTVPNQH